MSRPAAFRRTLLTTASRAALAVLAATPLGVSLLAGAPKPAIGDNLIIDEVRNLTVVPEQEGVKNGEIVYVRADIIPEAGNGIQTSLQVVTIENEATIRTGGSFGVLMVGGEIINKNGLIEGNLQGIKASGSVEIVNSGTIRGGTAGMQVYGQSIVTNSGVIQGDTFTIDLVTPDGILILDTGSRLLGAQIGVDVYEPGLVSLAARLVLRGNGEEDAEFSGVGLLKVEEGADWALSSAYNDFTALKVYGRLRNEGVIDAGDLVVYSGGAFGGGTVVLTGNATFNPGSLFLAEAGSDATPMTVAGGVTAEGIVPVEITQRGTIEDGQKFTLLTSGAPIGGEFEDFTRNALRLAFAIETGPNEVTATAEVRTFEEAAATENQQATGAALDAAEANGGAEFAEVIATVDSLGLIAGAAALDAFSGDFHASTASTGLVTARGFVEGLAGRGIAAGSGGQVAGLGQVASLTQVAAGPLPSGPGGGLGAWAALEGTFGTLEDENAGDTDYDSFGGTVGGDFAVMPNLFLGAALGFAVGSSETADRGATADSTVIRLAGYGRWFSGPISVTGALGASFGSLESERATPLGLATGETDATAFGFAAEGRYALALGGFTVSPLAGVSFTSLTQDAFEESGAGAASLSVGEATADSFRASLGAVASKAIKNGGTTITPEARLVYRHEFAEGFGEVSNTFLADATATSFTVVGAEPAADVVEIGAGVTAELANGVSLFGDLGFTLGDGQTETNVAAGLRMSF